MSKKILIVALAIVAIVGLGISLQQAFAKNPSTNSGQASDIPEQDGIYNVPGHPELKVRVFVHKAKPSPTPTPVLKCGLGDLDSAAIVDAAGWKLPANWTYMLNVSSVPSSVGSGNLPIITTNAFNQWNQAISNKVSITRGANTTVTRQNLDGKNIITWGTASGSALAVTYIWYNPTTKVVRELDTIMNQKFLWKWSGGNATCAWTNAYDAQDILTHELGHWYGLNDEYTSAYVNNTMYGYGSTGDAKADTLTTGDIAGVVGLY